MSLQDIREILLDQHDALRIKIAEARRASELWRRGACEREELQRVLESLAEQLCAHHTCEERSLSDIIHTIDAWGAARGERMLQMHMQEHRDLLASLQCAAFCSDEDDGAAAIKAILDTLLEHMKDEETYLLASDLLTDDFRFGEGFAG